MKPRPLDSAETSAPLLVLLPGWGFAGSLWSAWARPLASNCRVRILELPPPGPAWASAAALADTLREQVQEPAWWLGWSLGGLAAAQVAARYPQRVMGLVTLATNPCFMARDRWPGMAPADFEAFAESLEQNPERSRRDFLLLQGRGDAGGRELVRLLRPHQLPLARWAAQKQPLQYLAEDWRPLFKALEVPRLHLFAEGDALVPAGVGEEPLLARHSQLYAEAGHGFLMSRAVAVHQHLRTMMGLGRRVDD